MLPAEIIKSKLFFSNSVHGRAAVPHRADLVSIELSPPVSRRRNVTGNVYHAHELSMIRTRRRKFLHQRKVVIARKKLQLRAVIDRMPSNII